MLPFVKMEGCGNDFVVLYRHDLPTAAGPSLAPGLCDRRLGIGADGVLVIDAGTSLSQGDRELGITGRMTVWNADGSTAEMCGNGLRCVVRRLEEDGLFPANQGTIATGAGLMPVENRGETIRVGAGVPNLPRRAEALAIDFGELSITGLVVSMGNPHFVVFSDQADTELPDLRVWGPDLETHAAFPDRTNVEWAHVHEDGSIEMRVWERGVGETQACGSGACAVAVAASVSGRTEGASTRILLPGGWLRVDWPGREGDLAFIEGPARTVYRGQWRENP
ncbi:MAG: diaminopimelate epimerase [Myxococcota bacterium]|nr:diaminopimelate epimerase [Myxococcota bacterium]